MIAGIDPGKYGGIAFLEDLQVLDAMAMPMAGTQVDVRTVHTLFDMMRPQQTFIEAQQIRGNQAGGMAIGSNYGRLLCLLELDLHPHQVVRPAAWQGVAKLSAQGTQAERNKAAYAVALRVFGSQIIDRRLLAARDNGIIAALLIAHFGGQHGAGRRRKRRQRIGGDECGDPPVEG